MSKGELMLRCGNRGLMMSKNECFTCRARIGLKETDMAIVCPTCMRTVHKRCMPKHVCHKEKKVTYSWKIKKEKLGRW